MNVRIVRAVRGSSPWVVSIALALFGCAPGDEAASDGAEVVAADASAAFGPRVRLVDRTMRFPDGRPAAGWHVTPIHASLLPTGDVIVTGWSRAAEKACRFPEGSRHNGVSFLLTPDRLGTDTLAVEPIDEAPAAPKEGWSPDVLYCAGHVPIVRNGRTEVLYTGGSHYQHLGVVGQEREAGLAYARRFKTEGWTFERVAGAMNGGPAAGVTPDRTPEPMQGWRWYPTNTRLPDGTVLVSGGFTGGPGYGVNLSLEIYDPTTDRFSTLVQHDDTPLAAEAMAPGLKDYTHTFLLPEPVHVTKDGVDTAYEVLLLGWRGQVLLTSVDPTLPPARRFHIASARPGDAPAWDSTATMLPTGEILVVGGTNTEAVAQAAHLYDPKKNAWTKIDSGVGRRNAASVLLPDGTVLFANGWDEEGNLRGDRRSPQIFDPSTRSVTRDPAKNPDDGDRGYHSIALLLKDGRVLLGGGIYPPVGGVAETAIGCERTDVQIYTPPYLRSGSRPEIVATEPVRMTIGGDAVTVRTSGSAIRKERGAVLMALGSFTHAFDQNQRHVPLQATIDGGAVTLRPPASATAAPPGDYMLFVLGENGAPSRGVHVRLDLGPSP